MKEITVENFKSDKFFPRIVKAVSALLAQGDVVTPVGVFLEMGLLTTKDLEHWRHGRIPYLEKVILCNLGAAGRVLRILRMHAHDLNLRPSITVYCRWGKGSQQRLQFSKTNTPGVETAYSCHLIRVLSKRRPAVLDSEGGAEVGSGANCAGSTECPARDAIPSP